MGRIPIDFLGGILLATSQAMANMKVQLTVCACIMQAVLFLQGCDETPCADGKSTNTCLLTTAAD